MTHRHRDAHRIRMLLAQECARIMAEEGIQDFRTAKRKAAFRLAVTDKGVMPDNAEIERALLDYQRLFHADRQAIRLRGLRETALEAMRFLARFRPRLVGSVLSGTAGPHAHIHLHAADMHPGNPLYERIFHGDAHMDNGPGYAQGQQEADDLEAVVQIVP